jgi:hypothetical protein
MPKRGVARIFLFAMSVCVAQTQIPSGASATVTASAQTTGEPAGHDFFRLSLDHSFTRPVSGRLLLFIAPNAADAKDAASVDMNMMSLASVYVVAKEVPHLAPGDSVDIDADDRGPDGRPEPLFDRATGDINPTIAAYWRAHYDIVQRLKSDWKTIGPDLQGKIHLIVGTDDTFYLDGAAHSLQSTLDRLAGQAEFTFLPGRSHFDVYKTGDDRYVLFDRIAAEMYAVARPNNHAH